MQKASPVATSLAARSSQLLIGLLVVVGLLVIGLLSTNTWIDVILLGIIEGLTEFLPISSTAHLLIASKLLGFEGNIGGTFEIFIQLGAVLAVVGYYARDLITQARAIPSSGSARRFWATIAIAFLPAAVIGLLLRSWIKQVLFASPSAIAWALIIGGVIFIVVERWLPPRAQPEESGAVSLRQALSIGVAQIFALIPGVSRSGASIVGGMLSGLDRSSATRFSFYLAIPTLGAATLVDLLGSLGQLSSGDVGRLAVGTLVSMLVAWLSIGWLLRYVANHSFVVFGIYRIVAGIAILALVLAGVL